MELRDLKCFVAVAETLSFTRAADRLGIAQPPLSRRVAALEARLGVLLLRRVRPLELTGAGRFLFEQALQVLRRMEEVEVATVRIGVERRRVFAVGFVGSTLYGPLPRTIRRFRDENLDVEVGLHELTTHQQREALLGRRIDVGFGRLDLGETPGLKHERLLDEPLLLACTPDHVLSTSVGVTLVEAAAEPFILYPGRPRPSYADQVLGIFRAHGLSVDVALEANDVQTALGLVAAGVGVTLVPASIAGLGRDDVLYLGVDAAEARSPIVLSYRVDDRSPLLHSFLVTARTAKSRTGPV